MAEIGGRRGVLLFSAAATAAARSETRHQHPAKQNGRHGRARHILPGAMGSINLRYNGSILDIRVCDEKSFKFRRRQLAPKAP
uniref:Uncharacterized protein n=1 Tax=Oryza meridionalis TaxID=40149 RepID=A0A0E0E4M4_9ORYZ